LQGLHILELNLTSTLHRILIYSRGRRGRDHMVVGFITIYASVPITTNVGSSNPAQTRCTRYNIMW